MKSIGNPKCYVWIISKQFAVWVTSIHYKLFQEIRWCTMKIKKTKKTIIIITMKIKYSKYNYFKSPYNYHENGSIATKISSSFQRFQYLG